MSYFGRPQGCQFSTSAFQNLRLEWKFVFTDSTIRDVSTPQKYTNSTAWSEFKDSRLAQISTQKTFCRSWGSELLAKLIKTRKAPWTLNSQHPGPNHNGWRKTSFRFDILSRQLHSLRVRMAGGFWLITESRPRNFTEKWSQFRRFLSYSSWIMIWNDSVLQKNARHNLLYFNSQVLLHHKSCFHYNILENAKPNAKDESQLAFVLNWKG